MEEREGLPISFLNDRKTILVNKMQGGFLNFCVMPLFKSMAQVLPAMAVCVKNTEDTVANWANYEETEEDK